MTTVKRQDRPLVDRPKVKKYLEALRLGVKPWEIEGQEVECPVCGDRQLVLVETEGAKPGEQYHPAPEAELVGSRWVRTGRFVRDSYGRWLCICECSWDEAEQKVGPQTRAGLARVKGKMVKELAF